jgi:branched-chain amino acid transport system permease protein
MEYVESFLTVFAISAIAALALNMLVGFAGQLAITQGALMALGAYTAGVLSVDFGLNPVFGIPLGALVGGGIGLLFAAASLRLTGYDYVLISLILQLGAVNIIGRLTDVTGGTSGLPGIARPDLFGFTLDTPEAFVVLTLIVAALVTVSFLRTAKSPFALALRGFRDSEPSVAALGKNTSSLRLRAGLIAGLGAGLAGSLQASFLGFITPTGYTESLSILIIVYLLVGGMGNTWGAVVGVAVMLVIPQVISNIQFLPTAVAGPVEQILYGVVILLFVAFRPSGILRERPILHFGDGSGTDASDTPEKNSSKVGRSAS